MNKIENIKIIFTDIDGTLTDDNREISDNTKKIIERAKKNGIYVVLCSGRDNLYVCEYSKKCKASNYSISSNGALIYDYENDINIFENKMENAVVEKIWNYLLDKKLECFLNTQDVRYCNKYLKNQKDPSKIVIEDFNLIKDKTIFQIVVCSNTYRELKDVENWLDNIDDVKISNSSPDYVNKVENGSEYFLNLSCSDVSKGNAIKYFLNHINAKKEEAICFGDHFNDYEMFEECGYKVAMQNASDELKMKSDYITLSNNEDGVAYFIDNYIKI